MTSWWLVVALAAAANAASPLRDKMDLVFAWKYVDFAFPSPEIRQQLIDSRQFIYRRNMPLGFEVWRDKFFVTTPRRKAGVPVVLGYVKLNEPDVSPLVIPYPDYDTNRLPLPDEPEDAVHITTAYRIKVDACDRLWIIDTGRADVGQGHVLLSTPQILVYDLRTDRLLRRYALPPHTYRRESSFFATVTVEAAADRCDEAFAYAPDLGANGLLVYSYRDNNAWRAKHSYFSSDPLAANYNIDGMSFQLTDGAITASVSALQSDGHRSVFFHPLSSFNEFAVSTKILHNETLAAGSHLDYVNLGSRGQDTQSSASFFDEKTGVLFFAEVQTHSITCWNTYRFPTMPGNLDVVAEDKETKAFVYPCDVKVDDEDNLWVLSNNIPRYVFGDLDQDEYNHFIFVTPVQKALQGTKCDPNYTPSASPPIYLPPAPREGLELSTRYQEGHAGGRRRYHPKRWYTWWSVGRLPGECKQHGTHFTTLQ